MSGWLVFGGPYSNRQALEALRARADDLGYGADRIICTGDVVAYCADPQGTCDLIRDWGIAVVRGNCEESLGRDADDCGCGFEPGSACHRLSRDWFSHAQLNLDGETKAWMRRLPRRIELDIAARPAAAIHGGWAGGEEAISRFLFASQPDAAFDAEFEALGVDLVLAGHAGLPFARTSGERLWLNAGVIGMPANDGDPRGWFLTLDDAGGHAFHRLDYDWRSAALDMRFNGLPEPYARALETGLWPSLDVLPAAERAATGLSPDLSQGASPAI